MFRGCNLYYIFGIAPRQANTESPHAAKINGNFFCLSGIYPFKVCFLIQMTVESDQVSDAGFTCVVNLILWVYWNRGSDKILKLLSSKYPVLLTDS